MADTVPLIPRRLLFGNPDKASARISPDGSRLSYLAPVDGVLNVWVAPADEPTAAGPVTRDTGRGIHNYFWAFDNRHILYIQDQNGDENWRLFTVDLDLGETKDLTPIDGVQAQVQEVSHKFPDEVLVGLNDRDPQLHDLYRVDVRSGERTLALENPGFLEITTDDDFQVRFATRPTEDGGAEVLQRTGKDGGADGWETFASIEMEDALTTMLAGFDRSGVVLYMLDSRGRDTAALFTIDLNSSATKLVAEDPRCDVGGVMLHPTKKTIEAVAFAYEKMEWTVLDASVEADMAYLNGVAPGEMDVVSRSLDDQTWVVAYMLDDGPVKYFLYDREAGEARFLFTNRQELEGLPLVKLHPVVIEARDGLKMVSYYTLPPGSERQGQPVPAQPLPLVLVVHGGPWGRDTWGYNSLLQMLSNRGYATLSVNFRGSTGFGKGFLNAGNKEWGGRMHDDLLDGVRWAVEMGIADPERVAIMGGSYGGYATLVGMTITPEVFACGVDIVGPSNLITLMEAFPPYWQPAIEMFATRVGDHRTEEGRRFLLERSPLTYVDRISRPLLIGQGANDPRVNQAESDQIVKAMQDRDIAVTYALYPDEGHGFVRPENNLSFFAVSEAFLAQHIGGRFEPIGDDFQGSTIEAPAGAEQVPGLADALG